MMKTTRVYVPLGVCALLLAAGGSIQSQTRSFAVDSAQTRVEFTLGSLLHTVHGDFHLKRGALNFDPQSGKASGELVVDATTGESGNPGRDKRMHTAILESAKYPEIIFRPDRVDGKIVPGGKSQVQLHGMFTIHGAEHEILFPVTVDAAAGQYTVAGEFVVPYVSWGMKNPSTLLLRVNDRVQIAIHTVVRTM